MKKILAIILLIIIVGVIYVGWNVFGPTVCAPTEKYFYVNTGSSYSDVKSALSHQGIIKSEFVFDKLAKQAGYDKNVKPGRYSVKKGMSMMALVRMLKSGSQTPVRLVITKLRTKEDLASRIGKMFETDSTDAIKFLLSNDSLARYSLDTNTAMTAVIPNTYELHWNGSFEKIFSRLVSEHDKFWNKDRRAQAAAKNLTPEQVYTMASIVEEETNKKTDKGLIASVYFNRIKKGMKLEADPTVKYAMRNFPLTRILFGHLKYPSPYNTYMNTGLPPGPICTPSIETIDAVLEAPETDFIFFVAKPDFKGYSNFASNYAQHQVYARAYRNALDSLITAKNKNR